MRIKKSEVVYSNNSTLEGIEKHLSSLKSLPIYGVQTPLAEVKSALRAAVALQAEVDAARAHWKEVLARSRAANAEAVRVQRAIKAYLVVHHGIDSNTLLADFGFVPRPREQTIETKVAALGKRLETRKLRHVMGKRQKERIKAVSPPDPTSLNGAAPPAPPPAPSTGTA